MSYQCGYHARGKGIPPEASEKQSTVKTQSNHKSLF